MRPHGISINPVTLPHPNKLLVMEPLDYSNPYDFHHPHRHDYFEIIMVDDGDGEQLIDFNRQPITRGQLFLIYPGQVHLMQRGTATGLIIQFRKDIFEFISPVKHYHLYFREPSFTPHPKVFDHLYGIASRIKELLETENLSSLSIHKAYSYLQILLISLAELKPEGSGGPGNQIIGQFLSLLPQHIKTHKKVSEYAMLIGCSSDKLNLCCKTALGKTALELIHEEMLLEVRRLLLMGRLSLKEVAYELNFDSQANFSGFVKSRTGLTPSELLASLH